MNKFVLGKSDIIDYYFYQTEELWITFDKNAS